METATETETDTWECEDDAPVGKFPYTLEGMRYHQLITAGANTIECLLTKAAAWMPSGDLFSHGYAHPLRIVGKGGDEVMAESELHGRIAHMW